MKDISHKKIKVTYWDFKSKKIEKGIIKSASRNKLFVVYNCSDNWEEFYEYTAIQTNPSHLCPNWVSNIEQFLINYSPGLRHSLFIHHQYQEEIRKRILSDL